jgi:fibronectin-binding autotransporter adhesin
MPAGLLSTGGILQIGAGATAGSILGDVLNQGELTFNRNDIYAVANNISGTAASRSRAVASRP